MVYDNTRNYLKNTVDNRGNSTFFNYDATKGILKDTTDPNGNKTAYTYNANNDLLTSVYLDANKNGILDTGEISNSYSYAKGQLSKINHNGMSYNFNYDEYGKIISTKIGSSTLITNEYGPNNGKLLKSTYGNGQYFESVYDDLERLSYLKQNGTSVFEWRADGSGNLAKHVDKVNNRTYDYEYDTTGRLVRSFEYNGSTKYLSTETNYDKSNRVISQVYQYGTEAAKKYTYTYGKDNLLTKITLPNTDYIQNNYDSLGRLGSEMVFKNGSTSGPFILSSYSYLEGSKIAIDSDANNKATTTLVSGIAYNNGAPLFYTYDKNGNILTVKEGGTGDGNIKLSYEYDGLNQLVRENNAYSNKSYKYSYDKGGNITSVVEFPYTTGTLGTQKKTQAMYMVIQIGKIS